ncbi:MAG: thermonuclease family protein [Erythrobacter sp.]|uniref:thermonuclease family protein n=1 Tax=Erythrobacter sp. TaxID=1042 RepID=UPI001B0804B5|nr:thermonuclease family protein [Erythrobacter sp.]
MLRIVASGLLALVLFAPAHAQVFEGTATVIDGDTIDMTGTRIRIAHIDAPEANQVCLREGEDWACGSNATAELSSIIDGQVVVCTVIDTDIYGRQVATCQAAIFNIGLELVRRGMAIAVDGAPHEYEQASGIAGQLNSGLWGSTFAMPWEWRAANPRATPQPSPREASPHYNPQVSQERVYRDAKGCLIKGNRSRRGEWIYHLPGRPYYEATRAEEMFCTESEARAAGYRRSRA